MIFRTLAVTAISCRSFANPSMSVAFSPILLSNYFTLLDRHSHHNVTLPVYLSALNRQFRSRSRKGICSYIRNTCWARMPKTLKQLKATRIAHNIEQQWRIRKQKSIHIRSHSSSTEKIKGPQYAGNCPLKCKWHFSLIRKSVSSMFFRSKVE